MTNILTLFTISFIITDWLQNLGIGLQGMMSWLYEINIFRIKYYYQMQQVTIVVSTLKWDITSVTKFGAVVKQHL
jgi:hypothetical protein